MALIVSLVALSIRWRFDQDIQLARERSTQGSTLIATRCGPIEVQQAGAGVPLLATRITGAKFIGFEHGGHTWVGHGDEVMSEIVKLLLPPNTR